MPLGKRLPRAVYLHADALARIGPPVRQLVDEATRLAGPGVSWNVVKLSSETPRLSLLWYPRFFEDGFPELSSSTTVDLQTGELATRTFAPETAPILHRKETMLPSDHVAVADAAALTRHAEALGLFERAREIGHKAAWQARLARVGLRVVGHRLEPEVQDGAAVVARHRTALTRYSLSSPVQSLWRHGYLDGSLSVFDYGCGRGDDIRALQSLGLTAAGWDPHFAPEHDKREADVVNLGFVLNVIEDQRERLEALRGAWSLARRLLAVSVLIGGRTVFERFRLFRDGVLTARGTFQKYFTPSGLRSYLQEALGREPIAVAPGVAFVFRTDEDEQAFLARRTRARARATFVPRERAPTKWETHAELVDDFWNACLAMGRVPRPDEYARLDELRTTLGQPGTVFRAITRRRGEAQFLAAQAARRADLLVFLALNLFERRRSFRALPQPVQRDIRTLFGSYQNAQAQALALVFSSRKTTVIEEARLYGDVETADLLMLHMQDLDHALRRLRG